MKLPAVFTRVGLAAFRFRTKRADYYEYLSDIIQATEGQRTIKQIFQADADRYGHKTARGDLSALWHYRVEEGGDLEHTFSGTLPPSDVRMIGMLQRLGGEALVDGLRDLASLVRLDYKILTAFITNAIVGLMACLIVLIMLVIIPTVTVPELMDNFRDIDPQNYKFLSRSLFGFSEWLTDYGVIALLGAIGCFFLFIWALKNVHGPVRNWLDEYTPVGIYRDTVAIRVLVAIAAIIKPRGSASIPLREAISLVSTSADPWLRSHMDQVLDNLDSSVSGARIFNTGLLDKSTFWYLEDLEDSLGLGEALQRARFRLETRTLDAVARRATILNWTLVFGAVVFLGFTMWWHYAVIYEMRDLMLLTNM